MALPVEAPRMPRLIPGVCFTDYRGMANFCEMTVGNDWKSPLYLKRIDRILNQTRQKVYMNGRSTIEFLELARSAFEAKANNKEIPSREAAECAVLLIQVLEIF